MRAIDLSVASRSEGDWTILDVSGEVDLFTAPKLREHIVSLVDEGRLRIAVNLKEVEFMDSTGLGVLVGALKRLKEQGGVLALVAPTGPVDRVLSVTGLNKVFAIHDSVDQATAS